jgi:hypothetical protein
LETIDTTGIYYNKMLKCGIINCSHDQALTWFMNAIPAACGDEYRGWIKSEQVTTFVKIFVPPGFEDTSAADYLEVIRIMFETEDTRGIPWQVIKFYIHHTKLTHIIIATIPTATFLQIKEQGVETSPRSGVWKTKGFLAPLKLTLASENDLKSSKNPHANRPKPVAPATSPTATATSTPPPSTPPLSSPPPAPRAPPTPPPPPPPNWLTQALNQPSTSQKGLPLKDPFLSSTATSPLREDMDQGIDDIDDVVEEVAVEFEDDGEDGGEEKEMDLALLNPDPEDTEDFCGNWA